MTLPSFGRPADRVLTHCAGCRELVSHDLIELDDPIDGDHLGYMCRQCYVITATDDPWR